MFLSWCNIFVLLKGRSREEAFRIGNKIAAVITSMNPDPVTLKMGKVYHPHLLLTKKHYVGYSYETPGQEKPTFNAKGIETVRRDTCPAVGKDFGAVCKIDFWASKNICGKNRVYSLNYVIHLNVFTQFYQGFKWFITLLMTFRAQNSNLNYLVQIMIVKPGNKDTPPIIAVTSSYCV